MHAVPAAHQAPTGTKPPQQSHDATRFDPHCFRITLRTADSIRQDPEKNNGGRDSTQHEQATEDEDKQRSIGHADTPQAVVGQAVRTRAVLVVRQRNSVTDSTSRSESGFDRRPRLDKGHALVDPFHANLHIASDCHAIDATGGDERWRSRA